MNKKGFLLIDSLITVFIVTIVCFLCYSMYHVILNYKQGYINFQENSNINLEKIYSNSYECEVCEIIDESD